MQFDLPSQLKLNGLAGLQFEYGPSLLRFRDGETLRALLNVDSDLSRNLGQRVLHAMASMEINAQHDNGHQYRGGGKPSAQASDGNRHQQQCSSVPAGLRGYVRLRDRTIVPKSRVLARTAQKMKAPLLAKDARNWAPSGH